jgi:hypothetical protein
MKAMNQTTNMLVRTVSFGVALLACVGVACAQPGPSRHLSVEWLAAESPLIVRAVIDDASARVLDPHDPRKAFHRYQTISVRVLETVKGKPCERLQFVQDGWISTFQPSKLKEEKQELLLFLQDWMRSRKFDRSTDGYAYTRFPYILEHVAILTPQKVRFAWSGSNLPPLSANLTELSTPAQLIDAIKTYLKHHRDQEPVRDVTMFRNRVSPPADELGNERGNPLRSAYATNASVGEKLDSRLLQTGGLK